METTVTYWRDQVGLLLKSGAAIIILFAGWAIEHHKDFYLGSVACPDDVDRFLAAVGLLVMSLAYAAFLTGSVSTIYKHRLKQSDDETLVPQGTAVWIARALSVGVLLIAVLMSAR
jgi:hypothetical protein